MSEDGPPMRPVPTRPHEVCKCPRCSPRDWLISDLLREVRERTNVVDTLVAAAAALLVYQDDHRRELLRQAVVAMDEVERTPL
jgi:hypothetical protein